MQTLAHIAAALLFVLVDLRPSAAYTLMERPTASGESLPSLSLDGGFAAAHWLAEAMPISYWVNPSNPNLMLPLIVPAGRDRDEEFIRVMRKSFERWEEV